MKKKKSCHPDRSGGISRNEVPSLGMSRQARHDKMIYVVYHDLGVYEYFEKVHHRAICTLRGS
jgi:hypothetical protein